MFNRIVVICLSVLLGVGIGFSAAEGEEGPPPTIEELEKRVAELEKVVEKQVTSPDTFRAYWKDGLNLKSYDGKYSMKIGGRLHWDASFYSNDKDVEALIGSPLSNGVEGRRARLFMEGTINEYISFKGQYDFAGGDADFKDVYLKLNKIPTLGHIQMGQFKEPLGLEELTSSNYITFIERSTPVEAFAPSRNVGIAFGNSFFQKQMTFSAGYFKNTDDYGNRVEGSGGGENNYTARITALPVFVNKGEQLVHLGFGFSHRRVNDDTVRYRARPENHIAPRLVDTGNIRDVKHANIFNGEIAAVKGPVSFQGEYFYAKVNTDFGQDDPGFAGAYGYISYFFTGEHRRYKDSSGAFDKVIPISPYRVNGGRGAWEAAFRVSYLDLNRGSFSGGELTNITFGLNWYLNTNTRIMFNYVRADLDREDADHSEEVNQFLTRVAVFW